MGLHYDCGAVVDCANRIPADREAFEHFLAAVLCSLQGDAPMNDRLYHIDCAAAMALAEDSADVRALGLIARSMPLLCAPLSGSLGSAPTGALIDASPRLDALGLSSKAVKQMDAYDCITISDFMKLSAGAQNTFKEMFATDFAILQRHIGVRLVDVDGLLNRHLNNIGCVAGMVLAERNAVLGACAQALKPAGNSSQSSKRTVAFLYAMRGSGKTQLLKHLAGVELRERTERGRVIVRCLERAMSQGDTQAMGKQGWLSTYLTERCGEQQAMVGLITDHVREVTGTVISAGSVEDAYQQWREATAKHFGLTDAESAANPPTILLDTCEVLANTDHKSLVHNDPLAGVPYTLLEALALTIPALHGVLLVGCSAGLRATTFTLTTANVVAIESLAPLSLEGSIAASKVWENGAWADGVPLQMHEIVHALSGGIPRIHMTAFNPETSLSFAQVTSAIPRLLTHWTDTCTGYYSDVVRNPDSYFVALAAAVRWAARLDDAVPMPKGRPLLTFGRAMEKSMCAQSVGHSPRSAATKTYVVAPLLLTTTRWTDLEATLRATYPVLPALRNLFPIVEDGVAEQCVQSDPRKRGAPFERVTVHALLGRYLLASWTRGRSWVPLNEVLGVNEESLADVQVNLEGGVVEPTGDGWTYASAAAAGAQLSWNHKVTSAHHDAYLWARKGARGTPMPMAVQCKHGQAKPVEDLKKQVLQIKEGKKLGLPLLVCYAGPTVRSPAVKTSVSIVDVDVSVIAAASAAVWLLTPGVLK